MATRGLYGFYKNGINKLTYNHYDSYPSYLGNNILNFIKQSTVTELNEIFQSISLVNDDNYPNENERIQLEDLGYSVTYKDEPLRWGEIISAHAGDFSLLKNKFPFMLNNNDFIKDSLFCEWAYIINLDSNNLEIYRGFQKTSDDNRYKIDTPSSGGYYHCKLIKTISFDELKDIDSLDNIEDSYSE